MLHWIDPTSLEALGRTVDLLRTLAVLLIVTYRPEFEPPWIGRPHVTALTINRLGQREIGAMIDRVTGNKPLPASIRQDILERTDGIPLFVEEMTKAVLEAESEGDARQTAAAVPSSALAVPASLHASLMARLDRLGPAKEVAQIGAVIGREFSHALLAAVVRKPESGAGDRRWTASLRPVCCSGRACRHTRLICSSTHLCRTPPTAHLLREPRRALHARIAETLESQFADIAENQPEVLARHCTEAGLIEKAAGLWGKAGRRSMERSALVEATEQFTRALNQIATLPGTPALRRMQINLQVALIIPLIHIKGYAAPETKAATEQARLLLEQADALGEPPEDPLLLFSVLYGFCVANHVAFNGDVARDLSAQVLELAEKQRASFPRVLGHNLLGSCLLYRGEIAEGRTHLDQGIALYDPAEHRPLATRFGEDHGIVSLFYRSKALWMLGYPEAALADIKDALKDAREIGQAASVMFALSHAPLIHFLCGNYAAANAEANELIALADEKHAPFFKANGMLERGQLLGLTGRASDAVQTITTGITALRATGATFWMPVYLSNLARAYAELGQFDDAWRCIGEALTAMETTKEKWWSAEINRVAGEIALISPEPDAAKAQAYFERALAVARQQQAKSWELRAAMSMARLWRDQGKPQQARELLAPVYGWFTEGFDTLDLKEAKALLDELAS